MEIDPIVTLIGSAVLTRLTGGIPATYGHKLDDGASYWQVTAQDGREWAAATPAELVELMVKDAFGPSVEAVSRERAIHLLTAEDVAQLKGVKISAVYKAVKREALQSCVTGRKLFRLSDAERWTPGATRGRKAKEVQSGE